MANRNGRSTISSKGFCGFIIIPQASTPTDVTATALVPSIPSLSSDLLHQLHAVKKLLADTGEVGRGDGVADGGDRAAETLPDWRIQVRGGLQLVSKIRSPAQRQVNESAGKAIFNHFNRGSKSRTNRVSGFESDGLHLI